MTDSLDPGTHQATKASSIRRGHEYPSSSLGMRRNRDGRLELQETQTPYPDKGEVLIKVIAAAVNPVDLKVKSNGIPYSTGVDGAGEIVAVGKTVEGFKIGDRVMWHASLLAMRSGRPECGAFNQYAIAPVESLVRIPGSMDYQTAAALPCPGGTAQQVAAHICEHMRTVVVSGNEALFVQSASGAVGRLVIQILRRELPRAVIIGSASPSKHEDLRKMGVIPVPYRSPDEASTDDFELQQAQKVVEEQSLKLIGVVDFQGGKSPDRHYAALDSSGVLVCVLKKPDPTAIKPDGPVVRNIALGMAYDIASGGVSPETVPAYANSKNPVASMRDSYASVVALVEAGGVLPPETTVIKPAALLDLSLNELAGKLIVDIQTIEARASYPDQGGIAALVDENLSRVQKELAKDADRLAGILSRAVDSTTGLIAMNVNPDGAAANSDNSALDAARATRGLCDLALSLIKTNPSKAHDLFTRALANWRATRRQLRTRDGTPIHSLSFETDENGTLITRAQIGEHENLMRVNAGALYPVSDSVGLIILATKLGERALERELRTALAEDMQWLLERFYQPRIGTFTYHYDASTGSAADSDERGQYPLGIVGNDGTVYALSALLVPALKALRDEEDVTFTAQGKSVSLSSLVRQQIDTICDRYVFRNGSMWETYEIGDAGNLIPLAFAWQMQPVQPPISLGANAVLQNSHVGIGGHTVMAAGQIAAGASELHRRQLISDDKLKEYLSRSVEILNNAIGAGVVDWSDGTVSNGTLVEVPVEHTQRCLPWGKAAWQQYELVQTLLSLRASGFIDAVKGPHGEPGETLLIKALGSIEASFRLPDDYNGGFGDEWRYHLPQVVRALDEAND